MGFAFGNFQVKDRKLVMEKMQEHVQSSSQTPLLIFPEGTCVNNEYCVMFKRGAFDIGATVCPIAIKYNKIFVDAFWNSRRQSFTRHLVCCSLPGFSAPLGSPSVAYQNKANFLSRRHGQLTEGF